MTLWNADYRTLRWPNHRKSLRKTYRAKLKVLTTEILPPGRNGIQDQRVYRHCEPIPLRSNGASKILAYACGHCGSVYSTKFDKPLPGMPHFGTAYRQALEHCRRPNACNICGGAMAENTSTCRSCFDKKVQRDRRNKARAAEIIVDDGEPVCSEWSDGEWGDGYSSSLEAFTQWWHDEFEDETGALTIPMPCYVNACYPITPNVDVTTIFESISEELHEDAEVGDLSGIDALEAAIEAFNKAQTATSWMIDFDRIIVLDPERFNAYCSTDPDGRPDLRYNHNQGPVADQRTKELAC